MRFTGLRDFCLARNMLRAKIRTDERDLFEVGNLDRPVILAHVVSAPTQRVPYLCEVMAGIGQRVRSVRFQPIMANQLYMGDEPMTGLYDPQRFGHRFGQLEAWATAIPAWNSPDHIVNPSMKDLRGWVAARPSDDLDVLFYGAIWDTIDGEVHCVYDRNGVSPHTEWSDETLDHRFALRYAVMIPKDDRISIRCADPRRLSQNPGFQRIGLNWLGTIQYDREPIDNQLGAI